MDNDMKRSLLSMRLCRDYPGRLAIVGNGGSCTYEDMRKGIRGLEKRLREMGVKQGSRVALWSYNSANWLIAFFAIVRAGATAVLVNYSMGCADAAELLSMTETGFLLCGDNGETKKDPDAMHTLASLAGIPEDHCLDIRPASLDLGYVFRDEAEDDAPDASDEDATAFIIFTSGTTSQPKAVQISQKALTFDADAFNANIGEYAGRSVCVAVPLFHILGLLMSYAYLCRGATVCLPANYKPETLIREIDAYRISDMAAVGAIYLSLADAEGFEKNVVPNLHLCMIAGGMSTPVQMMRLELQYANATFINMYGQSEAAPLTMVRPSDMVEKRAQTVGQAIEGMDIRISDGKGGFLPRGEIGEVVARGENLMNGYDKLPKEKQPIDENGWLHTGDLGYFDEDGYLYLAGRIKDVIIRGGENISPSEIESALNQMENIREAKVMGAPHPIYGESVEACVTMTDGGKSFDQEALKAALRQVIARFKVPSHIFLYDKLPPERQRQAGSADAPCGHAQPLTATVGGRRAGGWRDRVRRGGAQQQLRHRARHQHGQRAGPVRGLQPPPPDVHPPGGGGDAHRAHHGRLLRRRQHPCADHADARMAAHLLQRRRRGVLHRQAPGHLHEREDHPQGCQRLPHRLSRRQARLLHGLPV